MKRADIHVLVNKHGEANYNIIKTSGNKDSSRTDSDVDLLFIRILSKNSSLSYDDKRTNVLIYPQRLNYSGKWRPQLKIDLYTSLRIYSLDLQYDGVPYIRKKQVAGNLITRVNTTSLALQLTNNRLRISKLPIVFNGRFEFLDKGYFMDFAIRSDRAELHDVFTAFPPQ